MIFVEKHRISQNLFSRSQFCNKYVKLHLFIFPTKKIKFIAVFFEKWQLKQDYPSISENNSRSFATKSHYRNRSDRTVRLDEYIRHPQGR